MKRFLILWITLSVCVSQTAMGWGRIGHDAIACIAACNLTKKAEKRIEKYLGHSIVYNASWMDDYRATPAYKHTSQWHTAAVNEDFYYTDAVRKPGGDAVSALEDAIKLLQDYKQLDDSTLVVNLKYVIHLVGDMHCPTHVRYPGISNYNIKINNKEYSYHSVWDSYVIESNRKWYYTEWQQQLDRCSRKEKKALAAGSPREWFHETAVDCRVIYDWAPKGSTQGRDFLNLAGPLAEKQILKAGYRLARLLNDLFG